MFATATGSTGLEGLVRDPAVEQWSRSAAVDALTMLADHEPALRDGIVEFFRARLSDLAIADEEPLLSMVASGLIALGDTDSRDLLVHCVENQRIDPLWINVDGIDRGLARIGPSGAYRDKQLARYLPEDDPHRSPSATLL